MGTSHALHVAQKIRSRIGGVQAALRLVRRSAEMAALLWSMAVQPRRRPTLVIFPSYDIGDAASNLRAWSLAPALRKEGWRCVVVPPTMSLSERRRVLKWESPDVVLIQQARHPLNRAEFYPEYRCVFDQDDADILDERRKPDIIRCCAGSKIVVAGSRRVGELLAPYSQQVEVIWTSSPRQARRVPVRPSQRPPIITWAHADPMGVHLAGRLATAAG